MANNEFMNAKEVADVYFQGKMSYQKVLRLTRNGILPATKLGRSYTYVKKSLDYWVEKNFNSPAWRKIKYED